MAKTKIVKGKGKKDVLDTDYLYGDWLAGGMAGGAVRGAKADVKKKRTPNKLRKRMKQLQHRQATESGRSGQDAVEEFYEKVDRAYSAPGKITPRSKEHKAWRKKRMDRKKGGGL